MASEAETVSGVFDVYSPRWGHTDPYSVQMTHDKIAIHQGATKHAECTVDEFGQATWKGYNAGTGNPLMQIFANDSIYAPEIIPEALGFIFNRWRSGDSTREDVVDALRKLFDWIDRTSRLKPTGGLLSEYFG